MVAPTHAIRPCTAALPASRVLGTEVVEVVHVSCKYKEVNMSTVLRTEYQIFYSSPVVVSTAHYCCITEIGHQRSGQYSMATYIDTQAGLLPTAWLKVLAHAGSIRLEVQKLRSQVWLGILMACLVEITGTLMMCWQTL